MCEVFYNGYGPSQNDVSECKFNVINREPD